jgi:hypothetical protein
MARRLIVRLFAGTVRYAEALELQVRISHFRRKHPLAPFEVPTPSTSDVPSLARFS